jgi:cation transport ATPase-like protein
MTKTEFWKQPTAALLAELVTSNSGLTSQEAVLRQLRYGSNDATAPQRPPALASIHQAPCQPAGHHPAGRKRAFSRYWRRRKLHNHRQHRVALGAA